MRAAVYDDTIHSLGFCLETALSLGWHVSDMQQLKSSKSYLDSHRPIAYLALLMTLYAIFHRFAIPQSVGHFWLQDDGWISWYTGIAIGLALLVVIEGVLKATSRRMRWDLVALAYVGLIYLLRELDFHRLFTSEHVTRLRFYFDTGIPFVERLIPAIIMCLFVACLASISIRYSVSTLRALLQREPWASAVFAWMIVLIMSQVMDQMFRKSYTGRVLEEILEATAAGLALLAVLYVRCHLPFRPPREVISTKMNEDNLKI